MKEKKNKKIDRFNFYLYICCMNFAGYGDMPSEAHVMCRATQ